jgi:hypothetical protein
VLTGVTVEETDTHAAVYDILEVFQEVWIDEVTLSSIVSSLISTWSRYLAHRSAGTGSRCRSSKSYNLRIRRWHLGYGLD